ncbi:hypothetical protein HXX76_008362 [Chlamydomonas incerta]|uniref:SRCR domain-containing protein n=1 Tax=Chlamydomonas incerta TaxID=51695 RepID=A0A835T800_CHLIN|nr:hypothetical protein HXX76_008362 [Chlamydomonas incerta]|eukprot:KAG2433295.1 hypothetical protein HXX76_008362 [Chlamydomonas incerta]
MAQISASPPGASPDEGNGVRLAGGQQGTRSRGRLEISSADYDGEVTWRPVCASSYFGDAQAQIMCEMMGYVYGRTYFSAEVSYLNTSESATPQTADSLFCMSNSPTPPSSSDSPPTDDQFGGRRRRRLLHNVAASDRTDGANSHAGAISAIANGAAARQAAGGRAAGAHRRGLRSMRSYRINSPLDAPYTCSFTLGSCDDTLGPLVGIECSLFELPPAPPPPPSPPSPPPAPPPLSSTIRLVGSIRPWASKVESNLCSSTTANWPGCSLFGRVELQLSDADGNHIWAPLCVPPSDGSVSLSQLAPKACKQALNWSRNVKPVFAVNGYPLLPGWAIPTGPVTSAGDFNQADYHVWVSVVGGDLSAAATLQDLDLMVMTEPCPSGYMFGVQCSIAKP